MSRIKIVLTSLSIVLTTMLVTGCGDDDVTSSSDPTLGVDWVAHEALTKDYLFGVASADTGAAFAAVGENGSILYSPDGEQIHQVDSPTEANLFGLTWTADGFVAVGDSGIILRSGDGYTWTPMATDNLDVDNIWLYEVVSNGSTIVAAGAYRTILTCSDGTTWTVAEMDQDTLRVTSDLHGLAWSEELSKFVAVGEDGTVLTSSDGSLWSWKAYLGPYLYDVAWAAELGLLVAVGRQGTVLTSEDGEDWDLVENRPSDHFYSVAWSGSQLVIGGQYGWLLSSPDAETFTLRDGESRHLREIEWSERQSRFIAVGEDETIQISEDGQEWHTRLDGTDIDLFAVASVMDSDTMCLAVGTGGKILTSDDGTVWEMTYAGPQVVYNDIWMGQDMSVIVGNEGTILYSTDRTNWDTIDVKPVFLHLRGVTGSSSRVVAVGQSGSVLISDNGVDWTLADTPLEIDLNDVAWSGSQFVAVGGNAEVGAVIRSVDGLSWSAIDTEVDTTMLLSVSWLDDRFIAVGTGGAIWTSTNGSIWSADWVEDAKYDLHGVASSGDIMLAVGLGGWPVISYDSGDTWELPRDKGSLYLRDVIWNGDRFVSVGTSRFIRTSP